MMDVISGLAGPVSGLLGAGLSYKGAREANEMNKKLAREQMGFQQASTREQMDFQERMSNTAYQRSMADMEAAGLNPILAFQHGGATTPGGASSSGAKADVMNEYSGAVSSALQAMQVRAEIAQTKVMTELMKADLPEKKAVSDIYDSKVGKALKWIERILDPLAQAASSGSKFVPKTVTYKKG